LLYALNDHGYEKSEIEIEMKFEIEIEIEMKFDMQLLTYRI
jgi:hypothetical protein